jgi:hypothetical protein
MRLNKKYPEAYTSGIRKSFSSIIKNDLIILVIRMNANQNNSLDEEDEDEDEINDLTTSRVN